MQYPILCFVKNFDLLLTESSIFQMSRLQLVPGSDSEDEGPDGDCGPGQDRDGQKVKPEKGRANEITKKLEKDFLC